MECMKQKRVGKGTLAIMYDATKAGHPDGAYTLIWMQPNRQTGMQRVIEICDSDSLASAVCEFNDELEYWGVS